jgi:CRISPR/Cas system-associated endoribonuclease Cas2
MKTKKNKGEITKTIITGMLVAGGITIAATNPMFGPMVLPKLLKYAKYKLKNKRQKKNFYDTFSYLKKKGMVKMEYRGKQIHISLTKEGIKLAGKYKIDDLEIKKPKKWDKKWRVLIFDIDDKHKSKREALRGKIKELGLFQLQKSVWVCPYHFQKEMETLQNFFGLTHGEMKVIVALEIENDEQMKTFFNLK